MNSAIPTSPAPGRASVRWLNPTVLGIGLASLFSDWSHETATAVLPAFLATMGAAAAWLGLIEGVSDGFSSFAKMGSGFYTDKLQRETYGRAFGFERMMDTVGAIAGPATAFWLLRVLNHRYGTLFALTLIPGLLAAALIAFLVKEKERKPVPHISLGQRLRLLPAAYRQMLLGVGLFGMGAFAHTLLILLATQRLTPRLGAPKAVSIAVGLYVLHNA